MLRVCTDPSAVMNHTEYIDDLLQTIVDAKASKTKAEIILADALDELANMRAVGLVQDKFTAHGWKFSARKGKKKYHYPEHILQQELALKEAKDLAIAMNQVDISYGTSHWHIESDS